MKELTDEQALEDAMAASEASPVFLYKHSTVCPVSGAALQRLRAFLKQAPPGTPEVLMVKVIESRPVSNAIARTLGVEHESPQLILVRDRRAAWSASHHAITGDAILSALSP